MDRATNVSKIRCRSLSNLMMDMAKKRLDQASVQKDQQKLRVNQAQEQKIRSDIQNKKR